ncbi:hypothetical protein FB107DRAFT_210018 [Schizophyllum commune]
MPRRPPKHPHGSKIDIDRLSIRSLESWAAQLGVLHVANGAPEDEVPTLLRRVLLNIQDTSDELRHGQSLRRLPMAESMWPNMPYRLLHGLPLEGMVERDDPRRKRDADLVEVLASIMITMPEGNDKERALKWLDKRIKGIINGTVVVDRELEDDDFEL